MTGNLSIINNEEPIISLRNNSFNANSIPSNFISVGGIVITDKNGMYVSTLRQHVDANSHRTVLIAARGINGKHREVAFWFGLDNNGNQVFSHPQIVSTYVNGTSGHIVYSNKLCEQWGVSNGSGNRTVTLTKAYADMNYNLVGSSDSLSNTYDSSSKIVTASTFTIYTQTASNYYWRTIGIIS